MASGGGSKLATAFVEIRGDPGSLAKDFEGVRRSLGPMTERSSGRFVAAMQRNRFAFGQVGFAAQDFIAVMSQPGLGFAAAMRASTNNIQQMLFLLSPLTGALAGVAVGLGTALIPLLIGTSKRAKEASKEIDELTQRIRDMQETRRMAIERRAGPQFKTPETEGLSKGEAALVERRFAAARDLREDQVSLQGELRKLELKRMQDVAAEQAKIDEGRRTGLVDIPGAQRNIEEINRNAEAQRKVIERELGVIDERFATVGREASLTFLQEVRNRIGEIEARFEFGVPATQAEDLRTQLQDLRNLRDSLQAELRQPLIKPFEYFKETIQGIPDRLREGADELRKGFTGFLQESREQFEKRQNLEEKRTTLQERLADMDRGRGPQFASATGLTRSIQQSIGDAKNASRQREKIEGELKKVNTQLRALGKDLPDAVKNAPGRIAPGGP